MFVLDLFQRFAELGYFSAKRVSVSYQVIELAVVFRRYRFGGCRIGVWGIILVVIIFDLLLLLRRRVCSGFAFAVDILSLAL